MDSGSARLGLAEGEQLYSNILSQDFDLIRASTPSVIVPAAVRPSDPFVKGSANERFEASLYLTETARI